MFHVPVLPTQDGVLAARGGLGHADVVVRPAPDRDLGRVEGDELADVLRGIGRERREERLLTWCELCSRVASGRRAGIETLSRDLQGVGGQSRRVEEAEVSRGQSRRGIVREPSNLLDLVDRETRRHVEHDLGSHGLRPRLVTGFEDLARPHLQRVRPSAGHRLRATPHRNECVRGPMRSACAVGGALAGERSRVRSSQSRSRGPPPCRDHRAVTMTLPGFEVTVWWTKALRMNGDPSADLARGRRNSSGGVTACAFFAADIIVERLPRDVFHHEDRSVLRRAYRARGIRSGGSPTARGAARWRPRRH